MSEKKSIKRTVGKLNSKECREQIRKKKSFLTFLKTYLQKDFRSFNSLTGTYKGINIHRYKGDPKYPAYTYPMQLHKRNGFIS